MQSRPPMAASPSTLTEANEVCVAQPVSCTRCHAHFIMPSCRSLGCLPEAISRQGCQQSRHLRRGTFDLHLDGLNHNLFPVITSICDIRRQPSQQLPDRRAVNFATSKAPSSVSTSKPSQHLSFSRVDGHRHGAHVAMEEPVIDFLPPAVGTQDATKVERIALPCQRLPCQGSPTSR